MNEHQAPEVQEFLRGPTDELAVREYLNVQDDGEIARLAAMMAPKSKAFDPAKLVDAAMALQHEAKAGLIRQREAMASTMNYNTLMALELALGHSPSFYVDDDDERLSDPVIGPVLHRIRSTVSAGSKQSNDLDNTRITRALAGADARTKLPRPNLPCDLEQALRYATNSPKVAWPVMKDAFVDFLGIDRISRDQEQYDEEKKFLKSQIEHKTRVIAALEKKSENEPGKLSSKREHEEQLKQLQDNLGALTAVTSYREGFAPGVKTPHEVAEESSAIFSKHWQQAGSVKRETTLFWFATDFQSFWHRHEQAYQKLYDATEKMRMDKGAKNRKAAQKGSASRERNRWLKHTEDFVNFLKDNQSPQSDRFELIKIFADKHCGLSTKTAQGKVQEFLGTLASYTGRKPDCTEILRIIRPVGIKDLTEDAVLECLRLMESASSKKAEKYPKKSR